VYVKENITTAFTLQDRKEEHHRLRLGENDKINPHVKLQTPQVITL
jgi:hypothetical protein